MRHSHLIIFTAVLISAVAGINAASAADLPARTFTKASPASSDWTGCYIGGNVGGAWHHADQTVPRNVAGFVFSPPPDFGSSQGSNVIGGAQIGCDYQFAGHWVIGVQDMFDFGSVRSRNNITDPTVIAFAPFQDFRTRDLYTTTARVGYLFTPQLLGYAKAGAALTYTDVAQTLTLIAPGLSQFGSAYRIGWTVGGGLEYMFMKGWSVFGEYNYVGFGRSEQNLTAAPNAGGVPAVLAPRLYMQTALLGVNYKFNFARD